MKILFISSGYKGIYSSLESWIQASLKKKHEVTLFDYTEKALSLQQIIQLSKPDLILTLMGRRIPASQLQWLKRVGIKTAIWLTEDPYYVDISVKLIDCFDYVFTIDSATLELYQKKGHQQVYHLPLATTPSLFAPKNVDKIYYSDLCLVGYPYSDRIKYIQLLLQYTSYKIQVVGPWRHILPLFKDYENISIHSDWVEPPIVANYYNGAKIVLNTHRPADQQHNQNKLGIIGKSINNRTFDVAACAAFQLIEFKEDLPTHFIELQEIVSFKSTEELIEKTHYYIQAENERKEIAIKGRERVLKEHTFQHRMDKMISIITNLSS